MIRKRIREYTKDGIAYFETKTYFCGILIYKLINSTTNSEYVNKLKTDQQKHKIIKGYEAKDKSKNDK